MFHSLNSKEDNATNLLARPSESLNPRKSFHEAIAADNRDDVQVRAVISSRNFCEVAAVAERVMRRNLSGRTDLVTRRDLAEKTAKGLVVVSSFVVEGNGGGITWFAAASAIASVAAVEGGAASDEDEVMPGVEVEVEGAVVTAETIDDGPLAACFSGAR